MSGPLLFTYLLNVVVVSFFVSLQAGCQIFYDRKSDRTLIEAGSSVADPARKDSSLGSDSGYFVAVPADVKSANIRTLYRQVYLAVDLLNRQRARVEGRLSAYLTELRESGYTAFYSQDDEIECDAKKCLIKLTKRLIQGESSLAKVLVDIAPEVGIKEIASKNRKRFVFGQSDGPHITCMLETGDQKKTYQCEFNLDVGLAESIPQLSNLLDSSRGRLSSCIMAPGTVRDAEEAKSQLEKGGLLALTAGISPGASVVGYLRYASTKTRIELLDIYLCGDLSQDHFQVDADARQPRVWIQASAIQALSNDAAILLMQPKFVRKTPRELTLEVRFRVVATDSDAHKVFGSDRFYLRFDQSWL